MDKNDTLKLIQQKSKQKLASVQGEIPIGKIYEAYCNDNEMDFDGDADEIWNYRGTTVRDADKILKFAQEGSHNMASCHAIHIRVCNENGKRKFRPNEIDTIVGLDPEVVISIITYMGGYDEVIAEANPDVKEIEKNSDSTHTPD